MLQAHVGSTWLEDQQLFRGLPDLHTLSLFNHPDQASLSFRPMRVPSALMLITCIRLESCDIDLLNGFQIRRTQLTLLHKTGKPEQQVLDLFGRP